MLNLIYKADVLTFTWWSVSLLLKHKTNKCVKCNVDNLNTLQSSNFPVTLALEAVFLRGNVSLQKAIRIFQAFPCGGTIDTLF